MMNICFGMKTLIGKLYGLNDVALTSSGVFVLTLVSLTRTDVDSRSDAAVASLRIWIMIRRR